MHFHFTSFHLQVYSYINVEHAATCPSSEQNYLLTYLKLHRCEKLGQICQE